MGDVDVDGDDGGTVSREGGCGGSSDHAPLPCRDLFGPYLATPLRYRHGTVIYVVA
jgi:hypothetical protein